MTLVWEARKTGDGTTVHLPRYVQTPAPEPYVMPSIEEIRKAWAWVREEWIGEPRSTGQRDSVENLDVVLGIHE